MIVTLLINHIIVGKIEVDEMSGIPNPRLETYIKKEGYSVLMYYYIYDFERDFIRAMYSLTEFNDNGTQTNTSYEFNSEESFKNGWEEVYQLNEI